MYIDELEYEEVENMAQSLSEILNLYNFKTIEELKYYLDDTEIIRKKKVDLRLIRISNNVLEYNSFVVPHKINALEFTLICAWMDGDYNG